jgi:serine/threonine protein phosphatase PrpC
MEPVKCISGYHDDIGKRPTMEDKHTNLDDITAIFKGGIGSFYSIYDGHGGVSVANVLQQRFFLEFIEVYMKLKKISPIIRIEQGFVAF